jgi:spermidine/putrescine transport system ATP-binding protein
MTAGVTIDTVSQSFGAAKALDGVSLEIAAGEFVVLLGPSGCGKTTLLTLIGGFAEPTSGRVLIGGRDMAGIAPKDRPTTTVFQDYALFPHLTLADNVAFGLRMRGMAAGPRREKAQEMLALVGLEGRGDRRPHELSGGQRQRVALARALAVEPDVLLLDEPLGALDLKLRRAMQDELKALQRRLGTTFVHVTHDQEEAMAIADRIVVMKEGRIEDEGFPREVYLRPRTLFSAGFMGEVNKIPVVNGQTPLGPLLPGTGTGTLRICGPMPHRFRRR